jgi:alkyldihydroxyacetonephosphate synthase
MIDRTKLRWNGWGWAAHKDALAARDDVWAWLAGELGMPALLATPARPIEDVVLPAARLSEGERDGFRKIVGAEHVRDDAFERAFHAMGRSYHDLLRLRAGKVLSAPELVIYPRAGTEVLALLAYATEMDIAVVPFGGGTSVVGGVTANAGARRSIVALDLSRMDSLLSSDTHSRTATSEAGIYGPALEKALYAKGLTLGHYPQSFEFSTLGGWIAHRGAGQGSNGYGRVEDWLLGVRLATPRGLLETKPFPASSAGPNLTELIIGSEGVFGVITEATFRVHPIPAASDYRGYLFRSFASGADTIRKAVQNELPVTMLRLSDPEETRYYRAFSAIGKEPKLRDHLASAYLNMRSFDHNACALTAGFEGEAQSVGHARERFDAIARRAGALQLGEAQGRRWREGRFHGPYIRDPMMDRGIGVDTLETATSWNCIPALYDAVGDALRTSITATTPGANAKGIVMCHISHAYADGASLYFTYIFPRALDDEIGQWQTIKRAATDAIVAHGGTLSHHHGVGEDHIGWMKGEKGALGLEVVRSIKSALDPKGILNPGKLIPATN